MNTRRANLSRYFWLLLALAWGFSLSAGWDRVSAAEPTSTESKPAEDSAKPQAAEKPLVTVSKNTPTSIDDLPTIQAAIQQAVEKGLPATVGVSIRGTFGSGVVVTEDGYVLTAGHVVARPGLRRHHHHARRHVAGKTKSKPKPWA